ncbi:MFS transporter [Streptomyces spectabilis]|uniref:MFS family permease n=1 Tax=Streptomyces spectabilis TaxID=68270 RepID=A0A5P2X730_STRST|nr:MFS transporter [Streptomyces spectabilis]MBB5101678.1 MFS family permease [Streptomyces spectabilis]MCI3900860.1 MFS transporter [Streptomyces spectabilis]QEV58376.1 MFS transporter [Streptomyces spectabilis]GGV49584.1 MFS transporter [Streptomyces spectabilis]
MAGRDTSRRTPRTSGPAGLWADPNYRLFLALQGLSALGDSFSHVAIPLLVLHQTGSVAQMGLVTGLTGLASIVTGLFAGVVADRVDRRRLLVLADVARCVLLGMVPLVWLFATPLWLVHTVVPVAGAFAMLFQVTYVTVVPAIVGPGRILKANSHLFGVYAVASAGGPMLAGIVAAALGPAAALGIDAATFAVSAVGILFVRIRPMPEAAEMGADQGAERGGARREFLAGARFLWEHPVLRPLTVLLALLTFLTYGLTDVIVYYVKHGLGHGDGAVGSVLTAGTLGTLGASFAVDRMRERLGFGVSWIGVNALAGAAVACLGLAGSVPLVAVLAAVMLFCTGVAGINSMSLRQEVTPSHLLGRVTSSFWTLHNALGPIGAAAVTAAAGAWGVRAVCLTVGACVVAVALTGTVTGIGRTRTGRAVPGGGG